jgi:hypothetical protein
MIDIVSEPDQRRDFKGLWLPSETVLDENLNWFEKGLLAEIDSYDGGRGCWMAHEKMAAKMRCSTGHLTNVICRLVSEGYLVRLDMPGRPHKALRAFYSRHVEGNPDNEKIIPDKKKIIPQIRKKLSSKSNPSEYTRAHAARSGVTDFDLGDSSRVDELASQFVQFSILKRWHCGKPGSTASGWTKSTIIQWRGKLNDLLNQIDFECVQRTLEWYLDHFQDQYVPRVKTLPGFCARFSDIQDAMVRASGECQPATPFLPPSEMRIVKRTVVH